MTGKRRHLVMRLAALIIGLLFINPFTVEAKTTYYLPTKTIGKIKTNQGWDDWGTTSVKRNKYGMITSYLGVEEPPVTYTSTYNVENGMLKEIRKYRDGKYDGKTVYKYKKGKLISTKGYTAKGKLDYQKKMTYKKGKLSKISSYYKGKLVATKSYTWSGKKIKKTITEYPKSLHIERTYSYKGSRIKSVYTMYKQLKSKDYKKTTISYNELGFPMKLKEINHFEDPDANSTPEYNTRIVEYSYKYYKKKYIKEYTSVDKDGMGNLRFIINKKYSGFKNYQFTCSTSKPLADYCLHCLEYDQNALESVDHDFMYENMFSQTFNIW